MAYFKTIINLALTFILLIWWQNGNVMAYVYQEPTSNYRETTLFELGIHHQMLGKH